MDIPYHAWTSFKPQLVKVSSNNAYLNMGTTKTCVVSTEWENVWLTRGWVLVDSTVDVGTTTASMQGESDRKNCCTESPEWPKNWNVVNEVYMISYIIQIEIESYTQWNNIIECYPLCANSIKLFWYIPCLVIIPLTLFSLLAVVYLSRDIVCALYIGWSPSIHG